MIQLASRVILGTNGQALSGSGDVIRSGSTTSRYKASLSLSGGRGSTVTRSWAYVGAERYPVVYSRSTR